MELKVFWFQNSEHVSGVCKQNDRDHEISRHGTDRYSAMVYRFYKELESLRMAAAVYEKSTVPHKRITDDAKFFIFFIFIFVNF
jgi:hypothetical protein